MALAAAPVLVKQRFRFVVEVGALEALGVLRARFRTCSELAVEAAQSVIFHGGSVIPFKMPGRLTMTDVTLDIGATSDGKLFGWFAQSAIGVGIGGTSGFAFKRPVSIVEKDRSNATLNRWHLANAFPVRFVAGDWDNESDDFTIQQVTLSYDLFVSTELANAPTATGLQALLQNV